MQLRLRLYLLLLLLLLLHKRSLLPRGRARPCNATRGRKRRRRPRQPKQAEERIIATSGGWCGAHWRAPRGDCDTRHGRLPKQRSAL